MRIEHVFYNVGDCKHDFGHQLIIEGQGEYDGKQAVRIRIYKRLAKKISIEGNQIITKLKNEKSVAKVKCLNPKRFDDVALITMIEEYLNLEE